LKRDWEIIRELLTKVEECTLPTEQVGLSNFPAERHAEVSYHMALLIEAGLVHGKMSGSIGPSVAQFIARRLTWEGHEFIDSIRSDTVWKKTTKTITDQGISMTFDLVKEVAKEAASALVKAAMGGG